MAEISFDKVKRDCTGFLINFWCTTRKTQVLHGECKNCKQYKKGTYKGEAITKIN